MVKKTVDVQSQTPEELQVLIKEAQERIEHLRVEEKAAKERSISEAVGKAGAEFEQKFGVFLSKRKQDASYTEKINEFLTKRAEVRKYLVDEYKPVRDTLVSAGAKEEYLADVIGEAPKAPSAKAAGTGTKAKRTSVVYPDGSKHTWVEFSKLQGFTDDQLEGNSAKRVYLGKNKELPSGYSEVEVT